MCDTVWWRRTGNAQNDRSKLALRKAVSQCVRTQYRQVAHLERAWSFPSNDGPARAKTVSSAPRAGIQSKFHCQLVQSRRAKTYWEYDLTPSSSSTIWRHYRVITCGAQNQSRKRRFAAFESANCTTRKWGFGHRKYSFRLFHLLPHWIRVVLTGTGICRWRIVKIDVETALNKFGLADLNVYVRPPKELKLCYGLWLLLAAGYGFITANFKWQFVSDNAFFDLSLQHIALISQCFIKSDSNGCVVLLVIKIVDDILVCGLDPQLWSFINAFENKLNLDKITYGSGRFRFYCLLITQHQDYSCSVGYDDRLQSLEGYPIPRVRQRQINEPINTIKWTTLMPISSSISWFGTSVSPWCAFSSSQLQQNLQDCKLLVLASQSNALKLLKRFSTLCHYPFPNKQDEVRIIAFDDASHSLDGSQLCYLIGMVYGEVTEESVLLLLSWESQSSRWPVRSTPAAEILAVSEALDEMIPLRTTMEKFLGIKVKAIAIVDIKDLYRTLTSQRNSADKSNRSDVNVMRFVYEIGRNMMGCVSGSCSPADVGTNINSPLTGAVALMFATGKLQIHLSPCEVKSSDQCLG